MIHGNTGRKKNALQREILRRGREKGWQASTIHGKSDSPEFRTWASMLQRCNNPNNLRWKAYGGRGITVCERWHEFAVFLSDMGPRPYGTSLDRINNDGNYEPLNCRWATRPQQQNNMRNNRVLTIDGISGTVSQWALWLGINKSTLAKRLGRSGWTPEQALRTQSRRGKRP